MKKFWMMMLMSACALAVSAGPYGKALQKARDVAGHGGNIDLRQAGILLLNAAEENQGVLPAPAGAEGVKKLASAGKLDLRLLGAEKNASEKMFPVAYVGGALGNLSALGKRVEIPLLFTKPGNGRKVQVLFADGSVRELNEGNAKSCVGVVNVLKKRSANPAAAEWKKLAAAAGTIDRAGK